MAATYAELDERLITFITGQPIFFVATAPCLDESGSGGHVNVSPKGYADTLAVLDPRRVAYLDLADRIADSCGYAVPVMDLVGERDVLARWAERKSREELAAYRVKHNSASIDGLPALT